MSRRTVLLVDQNESLLTSVAEIIRAAGHDVSPCRWFEEGRRYLRGQTLHAIVTELRLGAFNGLHLVLLADKGVDDCRRCFDGGATYLDKKSLTASLIPHLEDAIREHAPQQSC